MKKFLTLHYAVIKIDFSKKSIKIVDIESNFFVDPSGWLMAQNNRQMIEIKCKKVDFPIFSKTPIFSQKSKNIFLTFFENIWVFEKIEKCTSRRLSPIILRFFEPSSSLISRKIKI